MQNQEQNLTRQSTIDNWNTTIHRVNKYSYEVFINTPQEGTKLQSEKPTITKVQKEFVQNTEDLLTNQGFIHIKEYSLNSYECRCHDHQDLITDEKFSSCQQNLLDYKLKF